MKTFRAAALFLALAVGVFGAETQKISPPEAAKLVREGKAVLVDVREPAEWAQGGVAAPAVLLPKSDFDGERKLWNAFLAKNRGKEIITYCRSGSRANAVATALEKEGVAAANLGSLRDWTNAGLPTRKVEEKR